LVVGLLVGAPAGASASAACPGDDQVPTAATSREAAAALVCDINVVRGQNGLGPVHLDDRLAGAAQDLASDMATHHFLSHVSSDGRTTEDRIVASPYVAGAASWLALENIDWGTDMYGTPLAATIGWTRSDEHRAHMLDPSITDVGIGIANGSTTAGGTSGVFYVADFGMRGSAAAAAAPAGAASKPPRACSSRRRARHRVKHRVRHHTRRVGRNGCTR
jgi:uncharacterized protein YkwD